MLKITVELWPFGNEQNKSTLGEAIIYNDATGDHETGHYEYRLMKDESRYKPGVWKKGHISNFPRIKRGVWDLLYRVLRHAVAKRNAEV